MFHILNVEKGSLIIDFSFVTFVMFVTGEEDGPEFFLVTFVSSAVITLNVFSIRYTDFYLDQEKPCYFYSYCKRFKESFIIDFPFVTFIMLITKLKNLLLSFHILNVEKAYIIIDFPFVTFVTFVTGEKDGPEFFLVTFVSSGVITLSVFSFRYFRYTVYGPLVLNRMEYIHETLPVHASH